MGRRAEFDQSVLGRQQQKGSGDALSGRRFRKSACAQCSLCLRLAIPNVPTVLPFPAEPTGVVANNTSDFLVASPLELQPTPAQFIFVTNAGGINAWRPAFGAASTIVRFLSGHNYTGVTIGSNASGNLLFVADFTNGKIDVFDGNFNQTSVSGNFTDATVPSNFHPYNIQNLNGSLYVTYAEFSMWVTTSALYASLI